MGSFTINTNYRTISTIQENGNFVLSDGDNNVMYNKMYISINRQYVK